MASAAEGWTWLYLGRVFGSAADLLRDRFFAYGLAASLLVGVPVAAYQIVPAQEYRLAGLTLNGSPLGAALLLAGLLLAFYLFVALLRDSLALLGDDRPRFRDGLVEAWAWMPRALALQIVTSFFVLAGFVVLIVPGIIAYVMLFLALPAMIGERLGMRASLRRSRELSRGARWPLFLLALLLFLGPEVLRWLLGRILLLVLPSSPVAATAATEAVTAAVASMVGAPLVAAAFVELRTAKEGRRSDRLQRVFE
ncbi:YciC family protein [Sphingosinicella terrae]|uniref:YciC family protein n=1 Tax=Sphingosinicella terrae TaxID=2172047 RepID=UPI000E0DABEC|nr:YciC family protein [Sphingosinicella terrae]